MSFWGREGTNGAKKKATVESLRNPPTMDLFHPRVEWCFCVNCVSQYHCYCQAALFRANKGENAPISATSASGSLFLGLFLESKFSSVLCFALFYVQGLRRSCSRMLWREPSARRGWSA